MSDTTPAKKRQRNFTAETPFSLLGILISMVIGVAIAVLVILLFI